MPLCVCSREKGGVGGAGGEGLPGVAILLSALIWPLIILGAVQMGLWALASEFGRHATAGASAPVLMTLDLPSH